MTSFGFSNNFFGTPHQTQDAARGHERGNTLSVRPLAMPMSIIREDTSPTAMSIVTRQYFRSLNLGPVCFMLEVYSAANRSKGPHSVVLLVLRRSYATCHCQTHHHGAALALPPTQDTCMPPACSRLHHAHSCVEVHACALRCSSARAHLGITSFPRHCGHCACSPPRRMGLCG